MYNSNFHVLFRCHRAIASAGLLALLALGCDTEEEALPAFVEIAPFVLQSNNPSWHGSVSEKITNAKVFAVHKLTGQAQSLGVLSLPASVPVLLNGEYEINIDPVIKANGNSLYLEIYPFYSRYNNTLLFSPLNTVQLKPITTYKKESVFSLVEDFEGNSQLFSEDRDSNPLTSIRQTNEDVFEGKYSGMVSLDTTNYFFAAATRTRYKLSISTGAKFYMEMNYKTEVPFEVGVLAVDATGLETPDFEFVVLPKKEWNKIYFNLTELINSSKNDEFHFIIRAAIPLENGKFTLQKANILFDNIKVVHF